MPLALRLSEGLNEAATRRKAAKPQIFAVRLRFTHSILRRESVQPSEGFPPWLTIRNRSSSSTNPI